VFVVIVVFTFVVGLVEGFLVERVLNAFVEDLFGILWSIRTFRAGNGIVKAEFVQKRREIVWVIFDSKLLIKKALNLLFLPGLSLTKAFDELFLFGFVELRGP